MKRIALFTTIFVLLGLSIFYTLQYFNNDGYNKLLKFENDIQEIDNLIKLEKYNEALTLIEKVTINLSTTKYFDYLELKKGQVLYKQKKYIAALDSLNNFEKFIIKNQDNPKIQNKDMLLTDLNIQLALTLSNVFKYKEANDYFLKVLDNNLYNYDVFDLKYRYANNLLQLEEIEEAIQVLSSLENDLNINEQQKSLIYDLQGLIYKDNKKDYDTALLYYKKSYDLHPNFNNVLSLIETHILKNDNEEALLYAEKGISLIEGNDEYSEEYIEKFAQLYTYYGILLYKEDKFVESIHYIKKSESLLKDKIDSDYYVSLHSANVMYLMYIYYNLNDYELSLNLITEIKSSSDYTLEMKEIASEYEDTINKILNINKRNVITNEIDAVSDS